MKDLRAYAATVILKDGGSILIRAIRPDDKERLVRLFSDLSAESVYFRFFRAKKRLTEEELRGYTELDFITQVALVATLGEGPGERILGVARYAVDPEVPSRAEIGFAVADAHHGRGIGTVLLDHLTAIARDSSISEIEADVLGENNRMLEMLATSGFVVQRSFGAGVFHLSFPTRETPTHEAATHERERLAAAMSVRAILNPGSVAVVGASRKPGTIGAALIENLRRDGFKGPLYPVNPKADEVAGLRCYASVAAIGQPVDLAVIAVPAPAVEEALRDCAKAGVRGLVVISAGFAEAGREGRATERRMVEFIRASGMRMVGPNCMGVANTDPAVSLNATFAPAPPPVGNIGMSSQSGALGMAILDYLKSRFLGISSFVSVGNKADVSGNDLLAYWARDPRTAVIVLYLESFGNPRKFARVAPEVARVKPIVAVKSGRSTAGKRAASSHTAALASSDVAVDALFEQAGVVRTDTLEELFDVTALLATQPVPAGPRVGVITNAGGPAILLADACESRGLVLPELAAETRAALHSFLPAQAALANPVDMIASAGAEGYARTIPAVGNDPNIDAVVVIYLPIFAAARDEVAAAIARGASEVRGNKPVMAVFLAAGGQTPEVVTAEGRRIPCFNFPENAAIALAAAERYGRWRRRPRGALVSLEPFAERAVRAVIDRALAGAQEPLWLAPRDLATVLRAAGIDFASFEAVAPDEATALAGRLGYPLVAKAIAPGLLHKSDVGGVILGLNSREEVAAAVAKLKERMGMAGLALEGVWLQREVKGGIEAIVGVTTDPTFGPLVGVGLGGVLVELVRDISFRLSPVSDLDAEQMIAELRSRRVLDGYRGAPAGDVQALVALIQRVSALVEVVPEITELDLNPVKVLAPGEGAVVVDGRLRVAPLR